MPSRLALTLAFAGVFAASPVAQTTWIVDASSGPGTHFTQVTGAMLFAQEGDIVLVRPGNYLPFVVSKAVAVRGGPGVRIVGYTVLFSGSGLQVVALPAGKTATVSGFDFRQANLTTGGSSLTVRASPGRLILEDAQFSALPASIEDSEVWIKNSSLPGGLEIVDSTVVLIDSVLLGAPSSSGSGPSRPALNAIDATVYVSRSTLTGADEMPPQPPSNGVLLSNSNLTMTDDGSGGVSAGAGSQAVAGIDGVGALTIDPGVSVTSAGGAAPIAATINATTRSVPSLSATGPSSAGEIVVDLFSPAGENYLVFIGFPATPVPLPAFGGDLGLGAGLFEIGASVQGVSMHAQLAFTIGSYPPLIGAPIAFQALSGTYTTRFTLSNPAFIVLRH